LKLTKPNVNLKQDTRSVVYYYLVVLKLQ